MRRRVTILSFVLGMFLVSCGAVGWAAARPPTAQFVPAGAHNIRVQALGLGQWLLTYEAAGGRYEWYYDVATRLADNGWRQPSKWSPPTELNTYTLVTPLWFGVLWEQVDLHGDANSARIILRRWVSFPDNPLIDYVNL